MDEVHQAQAHALETRLAVYRQAKSLLDADPYARNLRYEGATIIGRQIDRLSVSGYLDRLISEQQIELEVLQSSEVDAKTC